MISGSWVRERRVAVPRLLPRRLRSAHTLLLVVALALIGWLGWTWYRGSSFVRIQRVTVTGLSGPEVPQIRNALSSAALGMTTLNVSISKLEAAVSRYGYVERLTASSPSAHRLLINVVERVPVALVTSGGQTKLVDADAFVLPNGTRHGTLPTVTLKAVPDGQSVTAPGPRAAIAVLAAAPYALLAHVANASSSSAHGVIVQLRHGPQIYFGQTTQLAQKWTAAVAVLQNQGSVAASYIDVSDPLRPAAGAGVSAQQATALGLAAGAAATGAGLSSGAG